MKLSNLSSRQRNSKSHRTTDKIFGGQTIKKHGKIKTYTLDQVQDELIGKIGTAERKLFEYELQMDLIGNAIKQTR
ncbi:hypothetical protein MASR2M44_19540 [Bacteroidota bacterium]